jgi:hypothetical protein
MEKDCCAGCATSVTEVFVGVEGPRRAVDDGVEVLDAAEHPASSAQQSEPHTSHPPPRVSPRIVIATRLRGEPASYRRHAERGADQEGSLSTDSRFSK